MKSIKNNKGFTLQELMVVVAIIAILAMGFTNLGGHDRQRLAMETNSFFTFIESSRNDALWGRGTGAGGNTIPDKWKMTISGTGNTSAKLEYTNDGTNWSETYTLTPELLGTEIRNINCSELDGTNKTLDLNNVPIEFERSDITFLDSCASRDLLEFEVYYKGLSEKVSLNRVSGVMERDYIGGE